jgi:hypothetical protein
MKRSIILPALVTAFLAISPAGVVLADNPHLDSNGNRVSTGQPGKEAPEGSVPGFDSPGFANAEQHYADGTESPLNPARGNTDKAVSQYDVAGFQWCQHHPC